MAHYFLQDVIERAFNKRLALFCNENTNCFRIFNGRGDGAEGLSIDYYAGHILLQFFNDYVKDKVTDIAKTIIHVFGKNHIAVKSILAKDRRVNRNLADSSFWKSTIIDGEYDENLVVKQNGALARVDLINGQNTGIFLDMREVREELASFYRDKNIHSMVNLFCYTAFFSVHAIKNGVPKAINVDLSKSVLKRAKENYAINGIAVDDRDFISGDAIKWIKVFAKKKVNFDFAIFDPPTFARGKSESFSVRSDYSLALDLLRDIIPHGYILTAINSHSISKKDYMQYHPQQWELLMFANESSDFITDEPPYLKVGLWKVS